MNEKDVVDILKKAENIGIDVWITGGWGVDALIGSQTRSHNDIDVFVQKKDKIAFIEMIISNGFREIVTEFTTDDQTVWCDNENRIIDLHLFEFSDAETLLFEKVAYPSEILNGKGTIGGLAVRCLTVESQVKYHQGYKQRKIDVQDVLLLCKTFGIPIPLGFPVNNV